MSSLTDWSLQQQLTVSASLWALADPPMYRIIYFGPDSTLIKRLAAGLTKEKAQQWQRKRHQLRMPKICMHPS